MEDRCLQFPMVTKRPLCFSTILPGGKSSSKSHTRQVSEPSSCDTLVAFSTMVSPSEKFSHYTATISEGNKTDFSPSSLTGSPPLMEAAEASCMGCLKRQKNELTLSKDVRDVLAQSIRPGTSSQYNSCWQYFVNWCISRETDPAEAPLAEVLEFLSHLFRERGLAYRTINCYRSAISSFHAPIDGSNVGKHPLVSRCLKGVFNLRPPLPKYTFFWDVRTVLDHLSSWNSPKMLDLKQLSVKSVTLLAINCHGRSSDLTSLDLSQHWSSDSKIVFWSGKLLKQSNPSKPFKKFEVQKDQDVRICPFVHLKEYIDRTSSLRQNATQLFVSYVKPHKPVTSSTLARWMLDALEQSSIDVDKFKAHSIRGASTSKAVNMGVSINDIISTADWTNIRTFEKFYHRPLESEDYFPAVLQEEANC